MFKKIRVGVRHFLTNLFAALFRQTFNPKDELDYAAIRDYRRIQQLRMMEEEKYRALYMGPRP
jgi:hypothetical protein